MTTKEQIIQAMEKLPEDATFDDAMDVLYLLHKIQRGIEQGEAGQTLSNEEVRKRVRKWLK
jgi:hypothetical protein